MNNTIAENHVGVMTFGFSSPRINENKIHHNALWAVSCYDYSFPIRGRKNRMVHADVHFNLIAKHADLRVESFLSLIQRKED